MKRLQEVTVSSFDSKPPPKKSSPISNEIDVFLSSKGGKPHVLTYAPVRTKKISIVAYIRRIEIPLYDEKYIILCDTT